MKLVFAQFAIASTLGFLFCLCLLRNYDNSAVDTPGRRERVRLAAKFALVGGIILGIVWVWGEEALRLFF